MALEQPRFGKHKEFSPAPAAQPAPVQEPVVKDSRDCPYCYHTGSVHCGDVKAKILANGGDLGFCSNAQIYGRRTPPAAQPAPVAIADGTFNHNCPIGTPLYTTPPAAQPTVPEGWKLVPIKPTLQMVNAIADTDPERESLWDAVLAAAPEKGQP